MLEQIKNYYFNLLPEMTDHDWQNLSSRFSFQSLKKGAFLTRQGETSRTVSFINKGLVRVFYMADGREISTGFVAENEYVSAYASFLTRSPSPENIDALEDCEFINLSFDDMQQLYKTCPVFQIFGRKIAELLFTTVASQTAALLTLTPEERYQSIVQTRRFVIQRVPQYMIASFIGITPEHLSRIRRKMAIRQAD